MLIPPGTTVIVSQNLAVADLGDEAVLLDPETGNYFGLNEVAARILELAATETTVDRIVKALLDEYDVDRSRLEGDVSTFVRDLESKGLLDIR